jgi:hypothetical protein
MKTLGTSRPALLVETCRAHGDVPLRLRWQAKSIDLNVSSRLFLYRRARIYVGWARVPIGDQLPTGLVRWQDFETLVRDQSY